MSVLASAIAPGLSGQQVDDINHACCHLPANGCLTVNGVSLALADLQAIHVETEKAAGFAPDDHAMHDRPADPSWR